MSSSSTDLRDEVAVSKSLEAVSRSDGELPTKNSAISVHEPAPLAVSRFRDYDGPRTTEDNMARQSRREFLRSSAATLGVAGLSIAAGDPLRAATVRSGRAESCIF